MEDLSTKSLNTGEYFAVPDISEKNIEEHVQSILLQIVRGNIFSMTNAITGVTIGQQYTMIFFPSTFPQQSQRRVHKNRRLFFDNIVFVTLMSLKSTLQSISKIGAYNYIQNYPFQIPNARWVSISLDRNVQVLIESVCFLKRQEAVSVRFIARRIIPGRRWK